MQKIVLTPVTSSWIKLEIYWKKAIGSFVDVRHVRQPQANRLDWTEEEFAIIREMYPTAEIGDILEMLPNRSWRSIKKIASQLKITRKPRTNGVAQVERVKSWNHWSEEEDKILREMYAKADAELILEMLPNRTWAGIRRHAHELGLLRERGGNGKSEKLSLSVASTGTRKQGGWTEEEIIILRQMYPGAKATQILEMLPNRTWLAIRSYANELGIKRIPRKIPVPGPVRRISEEDRKYEEEHCLITTSNSSEWLRRWAIREARG